MNLFIAFTRRGGDSILKPSTNLQWNQTDNPRGQYHFYDEEVNEEYVLNETSETALCFIYRLPMGSEDVNDAELKTLLDKIEAAQNKHTKKATSLINAFNDHWYIHMGGQIGVALTVEMRKKFEGKLVELVSGLINNVWSSSTILGHIYAIICNVLEYDHPKEVLANDWVGETYFCGELIDGLKLENVKIACEKFDPIQVSCNYMMEKRADLKGVMKDWNKLHSFYYYTKKTDTQKSNHLVRPSHVEIRHNLLTKYYQFEEVKGKKITQKAAIINFVAEVKKLEDIDGIKIEELKGLRPLFHQHHLLRDLLISCV